MSSPKRTDPVSARVTPVTTLKRVDLPEPFGPITPVIRCGQIARVALLSACTPPKRIETSSMARIGEGPFAPYFRGRADGVFGLLQDRGRNGRTGLTHSRGSGATNPNAERARQPAREDQHHQRDDAAEDDLVKIRVTRPDLFRHQGEQDGADDRPENRGLAADDRAGDGGSSRGRRRRPPDR